MSHSMDFSNKNILCMFAHPDDESYIVGGTIALAARQGTAITVISATKGDKGFQNVRNQDEKGRLIEIREKELFAAGRILGVQETILWAYPDGGLDTLGEETREELLDRLDRETARVQPDFIMSFGPDGVSGHRDHIAMGIFAAQIAARYRIPAFGITYPKELNKYLERVIAVRNKTAGHFAKNDERYRASPSMAEVEKIDIADVFEIKCAACRAHKSQDPEGLIAAWLEQPQEFWQYEYFLPL